MVNAILAGIGVATPPDLNQEILWRDYFAARTGHDSRAERIFGNAGVDNRHGVVNPLLEDVSETSTATRMARYEREALPLAERAVTEALDNAGIDAASLGMLVLVSCTGYATPGLDSTLPARLGASADLQRAVVGHMGCYAALPGLRIAGDFVAQTGRPAAMLCVELTSLHLQPGVLDSEQAVAHALFSDAAACAVLRPAPAPGPALADVTCRTDYGHADAMTWHVTDTGFRMGLSSRVPLVLARHLPDTVTALLREHDLDIADVDAWAVHPGGRGILDVAEKSLRLDGADLHESRETLRRHGNCSSATILLVLRAIYQRRAPRDTVAAAFGPGLTLYTALLRS